MQPENLAGFFWEQVRWVVGSLLVIVVVGYIWLHADWFSQQSDRPSSLPEVPHARPIERLSSPLSKNSVNAIPQARLVSIRPAQMGLLTRDEARGLVVGAIAGLPGSLGLPKNVRVGLVVYTLNPDGSRVDIPESNISFTMEPDGRLKTGISAGINVKISLPVYRLQDLSQDLCNTVQELMRFDEVVVEMDLTPPERVEVVSSFARLKESCGIQ